MKYDPRAAEARVGTTLAEKYRLLRLLGVGGMGAVYEAQHEFTNRRVAIKLLHPEIAVAPNAVRRFVREARAPASIGHPGIVDVLDGGQEADGTLYLVHELLTGEHLGAAFAQGKLSVNELLKVVQDVLAALAAAHAQGFIHRDVKPENIFLVGSSRVDLQACKLEYSIVSPK